MPIQDLCFNEVITARKNDTIYSAAKRMSEEGVGALVVLEDNDSIAGIITDRDIVVSAVAKKIDATTHLSEVMTKNVLKVARGSGVAEVIEKMESHKVRRAVVVNEQGRACGLISSDDLLQLLGGELRSLGNLVSSQSSRRSRARVA